MNRGIVIKTPDLAVIRHQAEERLCAKKRDLHSSRSKGEMQRLVHELEVHQIELEMQNEELRQAREEIEVSRNRYVELYDFAPVGYFSFDLHGTIREVNLAGTRLLGVAREFLVNRPFVSFIADANGRELFSHHLEAVLNREGMQKCELRLTGKGGTMIHGQLQSIVAASVDGNKDGYILCSIVDGTIAKQLEREIQDAREYAENIVETVHKPLVVLNSDLKVLTVNQSFYETFKVTPEETIGNFIYDLGNRQWDNPSLRLFFEEILRRDTIINGYEVEHDFQGIGHRIILLNARQIFRGTIGSYLILLGMDDITERKQLEVALKKSYDALEQTNRELDHFNKLFVNRELKMVELKKQIRELEIELHGERQPPESDL